MCFAHRGGSHAQRYRNGGDRGSAIAASEPLVMAEPVRLRAYGIPMIL